jgi:hypothetical protein
MDMLSRVAEAMQTILTVVADQMAVTSGFIKRLRKLSGCLFVQTLVFGWLSNPEATLDELSQTAATLGLEITPQGLDKRFTPEASECLKQVLEASVETVITVDSQSLPILQRFNGVYLQDSSTITLPDELSALWLGCGGSSSDNTQSSVKIQVRWDVKHGAIIGPYLQDGRQHDNNSCLSEMSLPTGALRLADLGYFSLDDFADMNRDGVYWLTRVKSQCLVYDREEKQYQLVDFLKRQSDQTIDQPILLGAKKQVPCRLLAVRVADDVANKRRRRIREYARNKGKTPSQRQLALADWTVLATNVEAEKMSLTEAMVMMRVRWQIELLFKLWKNQGQIDESRSEKPWRILCEFYAKLIVMIVQHWMLLIGCWQYPDRSFTKASKAIRRHAMTLAVAFAKESVEDLIEVLEIITRSLASGCKMYKRKKNPNTYQILLADTS